MLLVRQVFHAKYGRGDALIELFKESAKYMPIAPRSRLMTDASGQMFTIVTEHPVESFAAWEQSFAELLAGSLPIEMAELMERMNDLIESGSREFYTIVDET